jgi:hypothetical protein
MMQVLAMPDLSFCRLVQLLKETIDACAAMPSSDLRDELFTCANRLSVPLREIATLCVQHGLVGAAHQLRRFETGLSDLTANIGLSELARGETPEGIASLQETFGPFLLPTGDATHDADMQNLCCIALRGAVTKLCSYLRSLLKSVEREGQNERKTSSAQRINKKCKPSAGGGDKRLLIVSALTEYHKYADGGCLNCEPIGVRQLAGTDIASAGTISNFFDEEFGGHDKYKAACCDPAVLGVCLKMLTGELKPKAMWNALPRNMPA